MPAIKHNGKTYSIPAGGDAEATFQSLQAAMPELSNAKLSKPDKDGNYAVEQNLGTKG